MLVSQPPMQTMVIEQGEHGVVGTFERRTELRDLSLRMGALYDLTVSFISNDDVMRFRMHWHDHDGSKPDLMLELFVPYSCTNGLSRGGGSTTVYPQSTRALSVLAPSLDGALSPSQVPVRPVTTWELHYSSVELSWLLIISSIWLHPHGMRRADACET
ncbi:hypothetical protein C8R45DRAFT_1169155 [Mycena sanguinolenta]|nr:hypothetical protein C8R45DRAFT_1169155 [Mycena sanguinolenta]